MMTATTPPLGTHVVVKPPNWPGYTLDSPGPTSKPSLHHVTFAFGLLEADSQTSVVSVLAVTSLGSDDTFTAAGGTAIGEDQGVILV